MTALRQILVTLARALVIGFSALLGQRVVAPPRGVLDRASGSVLVSVAGVLDQLSLGLLEPLCLALTRLGKGTLGLALRFHRRRIRAPYPRSCSANSGIRGGVAQ